MSNTFVVDDPRFGDLQTQIHILNGLLESQKKELMNEIDSLRTQLEELEYRVSSNEVDIDNLRGEDRWA